MSACVTAPFVPSWVFTWTLERANPSKWPTAMLIYLDWTHSLLYITSPPGVKPLETTWQIYEDVTFPSCFPFSSSSFSFPFHYPPSFHLFYSFSFRPHSTIPLFHLSLCVLVNSPSRRRMCSTGWGLGGHSCPITPWFINLLQLACMEMLFCSLALVVTYRQRGRLFVFLAAHP